MKTHPLRHAWLASLALVLAACQFRDLKPSSHVVEAASAMDDPVPSSLTFSTSEWPTQAWWTQLGDSQLDRLVETALATNPSLRLADARLGQADAVAAREGAALEPRLDNVLSMSRQRFAAHGTTPPPVAGKWKFVNQEILGLSYEIDFWGKNRETLAGAVGRQRATAVDAAAARLLLSVAVAQVYVSLQAAYEQLDIETQLLEQQEAILDLTSRRFHADLDSQVDIKQAASTVPVRHASIAALNEAKELLENQLVSLIGAPSRAAVAIERPHMAVPEVLAIPSRVPAELIGRRPDVVADRWRVEAASHDIKAAKARFYPNVDLAASLGIQSLGFEGFDHSENRILGIGPAVSLPLFDGGRLRAGLAMRDAEYDAAVEIYNAGVISAVHDVTDQITSMRWLKTRMSEQTEAVDTADQAAELVRRRYKGGLATYIQVLATESTVLTQRKALADLRAHALALRINLFRALGGGVLGADGSQMDSELVRIQATSARTSSDGAP